VALALGLPCGTMLRLTASVLRVGAAPLDQPLLDLGAQRSRFGLDLRQSSKEFFEFLWSQVRHAREATRVAQPQSAAVGVASYFLRNEICSTEPLTRGPVTEVPRTAA